MFSRKLSREQRIKMRLQRQENELIKARAKETFGFQYVVNPPEIPRVVFGSSLEREPLPLQGPCVSPFMRRHQGEVLLGPGPAGRVDKRDLMEFKYPSGLGFSAFANKLPRLPFTQATNYPGVGAYNMEVKKPTKNAVKPFNTGALREELQKFFTPAPNTYVHRVINPPIRINTAFGTQRKMTPCVQILCTPHNISQCHVCQQRPKGDYWRNFDYALDLCRPCRHNIERQFKSCSATEIERLQLRRTLMNYRLVRYCGFFHDHNGTTAAIELISTKTLKFKLNKENYLSLYM